MKHSSRLTTLAAIVITAASLSAAQSMPQPQWVGSWATSPMQATGVDLRLFSSVTLREIVHISAGGDEIRLRFTNEFGLDPLTVADAHVALSAGGGAIQPGSDRAVTFGGAASVNIPPGAAIFSDPVALAVAPLADLAVSFYLPPQIMRVETYHWFAGQDNYLAEGHAPAAPTLPQATTLSSWYFFDGIDVAAAPGSRAIVAFGDSITDGMHLDAQRQSPLDRCAGRAPQPESQSGPHRRAQRGHQRQPRPQRRHRPQRALPPRPRPARAKRRTLRHRTRKHQRHRAPGSPAGSLGRHHRTAIGVGAQADRRSCARAWHRRSSALRSRPTAAQATTPKRANRSAKPSTTGFAPSGVFDGVIDFDKITRDPQNPTRFNPAYDSGDHLHPNDAGYKAMGEGIDLTLFTK